MKTRRTIKGTSVEGVVEEAYTPSNPPPYATNATNIIPDSNGAVNPLGRKADSVVGNLSTALGNNTTASGEASTALGRESTASGGASIAIGSTANASGTHSTAIGYGAEASGILSTALGRGATALIESSIALGNSSKASNTYSTTLGFYSTASGRASTALGVEATASGRSSTALGDSSEASGEYSTALGYNATAPGGPSTALGSNSDASAVNSTAVGNNSTASGEASTALGFSAFAPSTASKTIQLGDTGLSTLHCAVELTVGSDKRDKTDIASITDALAFVEKLNPITFVRNYRVKYISDEDKKGETFRKYGMCEYDRVAHAAGTKKGERRRCGLLAQEVVAAMQEVYGTDNYADIVNDNFHDLQEKPSDVENKYTLAYANLVPFLIGAIKELNAEIKILKDKLNDNN